MCGIAGIVVPDARTSGREAAERMVAQIAHRGPDARGAEFYRAAPGSVALGHARLAIIDLSPAGRQPMASACGRYTIVFNGEIYNYREIRDELRAKGETFRTDSDTEVLLAAIRVWGVECFNRLNGMWAFACFDSTRGEVLFARDRVGIKPLYYEVMNGALSFSSEIKALLSLYPLRRRVNLKVAARYLRQSVLDADDETFFEGIYQLPAGHYARVRFGEIRNGRLDAVRYWAPPAESVDCDAAHAAERTRALLEDSVRLRLRSDVPVGVLLSGGVDSSSIAAAMTHIVGCGNVTLLSAVSEDARFDESPFIDRVAAHLRNPVTKVRLSFEPENLWRLFGLATWHNDEPLLSFSSVAHFQLMAEAKKAGVTVVLSGQGADELFCGYRKYVPFYAASLARSGRYADAAAMLAKFVVRGTVFSQFNLLEGRRYLPRVLRRERASAWGRGVLEHTATVPLGISGQSMISRQIRDLTEVSVPVLLHYEDRMSMAHAREIRLPFLDYRMIEATLPLPTRLKLNDGWTKWTLRKAVEPWLPREIVWRRDKQGFINPQSEWLRVALRPQMEELLRGELRSAEAGLVDADKLRKLYECYVTDGTEKRVTFKELFGCIAVEMWMQQFSKYLA